MDEKVFYSVCQSIISDLHDRLCEYETLESETEQEAFLNVVKLGNIAGSYFTMKSLYEGLIAQKILSEEIMEQLSSDVKGFHKVITKSENYIKTAIEEDVRNAIRKMMNFPPEEA